MSRTFAYLRVSTTEQTVKNQIIAIEARGYQIEPQRVISETVSGSTLTMERKAFQNMVEHKLEKGDTLVVLKLDRLGRDNIDVQQTVQMLTDKDVKLICLDLPVSDLSSSEGKLMLQMFSAFAEFERNRIRERSIDGQARARKEGKQIGRPAAIETTKKVQEWKKQGHTQSQVATLLDVSVMTVKRHWNKSV